MHMKELGSIVKQLGSRVAGPFFVPLLLALFFLRLFPTVDSWAGLWRLLVAAAAAALLMLSTIVAMTLFSERRASRAARRARRARRS